MLYLLPLSTVIVRTFHKINIFIANDFLQWNDQCEHDECMHYFQRRLHWSSPNTDRWNEGKKRRRKTEIEPMKNEIKIPRHIKRRLIKLKLNGAISMALVEKSFLWFWHCNQYFILFTFFNTLSGLKIRQKKNKARVLPFLRKKYVEICGLLEILLLNDIEHSRHSVYILDDEKTTISHTNAQSRQYFLFHLTKIIWGLMTRCM